MCNYKCEAENNRPLASIWCVTYNHSGYIKDAIEGFLTQKTTFPYEIVIHDDASTDGTQEILREYEKKYPDLIRVIYQEKNIHKRKDRREIMNGIKKRELRGKYVAACEGDDYWIDPYKLQKQVEYLENHKECVMVVHNHIVWDCETGEKTIQNEFGLTGIVSADSIIMCSQPSFQTASFVMRKELCIIDPFFANSCVGDYAIKLYSLSKGYIYYMDDVMSIYRYKANGSWSAKNHDRGKVQIMRYIQSIVFLKEYDKYTLKKYTQYVKARIRFLAYGIYFIAWENKECFDEIVEDLKKELDSMYYPWIYSIVEGFRSGSRIEVQLPDLLEYCKAHKDIWIWGTGTVSDRFSKALEEAGVDIQGYIVTKKDGKDVFHGKEVWEIQDFPYDRKMGIVVAATAWWSYEITEVMCEYGITNYYCGYEKGL